MNTIINKLKQKFLYKIRYQITLLFFFVTFLPIVCIQLLNYSKTSELLLAKNQSLLDDNLSLTRDNINNILGDYRQILFQISTDTTCMDNILQLSKVNPDSAEYRHISESLGTYIRSNILMYPEIQAVGIVSTNGTPYMYVQKREKTQSLIDFFETEKDELNQYLMESSTPLIDSIPVNSPYYDSKNPEFFLGSRTIHYEKLKITGSIILFINPEKINASLNNRQSQVYQFSDKILCDSTGRLICSKENNPGMDLFSLEQYNQMDWSQIDNQSEFIQDDYLISVSDLDYFNLKLITIINHGLMNQDIQTLWSTIMVIISIILISTILMAFTLCRSFIYSIEEIAKNMCLVDENHLDVQIATMSKNELRVIEKSFNGMMLHIKQLLSENKRQYEHIIEINQKACEAELKSLELQINPHFLFNTIDSINWTAIQENCIGVSEQLNKLADILRHTVYNMNSVVPLQTELQWLVNYLDLQKTRFHNKFTYDIRIQAPLASTHIHKLLLQPFLENALIHGFENIHYQGHLEILCRSLKDTWILFQITDNGTGLSPEQVRSINRLFSTGEHTMSGVGLANIAYRMKGYYPHSRIFVCSSPYNTCFKIFIPINEMEAHHV